MGDTPITVWGDGEPVVLVHGSGDTDPALVWQHQRPLAQRYQLFVVTRPGYGERPVLPRADVEQDVREILALLAAHGGGHLVGFSYGGSVALMAAGRRPELVRSLVAIEPPAFAVARGHPAVEDEIALLQRSYAPERPLTTEEFLVRFMRALGQDLPEGLTLSPGDRKGIEAMRAEPAPWELDIPLAALRATTFPRLVVSGDWHPAFEAVADVLTQQLPAERIVCGGVGHYIVDAGERFNRLLDAFLRAAIRPDRGD